MRPFAKRQFVEILDGMADAMAEQPEAVAMFGVWDAQLGVTAKARRASRRAATREDRLMFDSIVNGRAALWADAGELVGQLGIVDKDPVYSRLAILLVDRFVRDSAARGGLREIEDPPRLDVSPTVGRRLSFVVEPHWPTRVARYHFQRFSAEFAKAMKKSERSAAQRGRPPTRETAIRDGRWLFLSSTNRATPDELARAYHAERGPRHELATGDGSGQPCDHCVDYVDGRIRDARKILDSLT